MKFVIGDIHGEISKLKLLVSIIKKKDKNPELIFIGDYIDKGESSKETLDYLIKLKKELRCIFIEGNHEYQWINLSKENNIEKYLIKYGGLSTIHSFSNIENVFQMKSKLLSDYADFFNDLIPYWENKNYIITHSGIPPKYFNKNIKDIEKRLLIFNRYDFIKMKKKYNNKVVIFGHTGFFSPYYDSYKIGIDTAACYMKSQPITSFCLEKKYFINSNNLKKHLKEIDLKSCPNIVRHYVN